MGGAVRSNRTPVPKGRVRSCPVSRMGCAACCVIAPVTGQSDKDGGGTTEADTVRSESIRCAARSPSADAGRLIPPSTGELARNHGRGADDLQAS
jgi:hypothetical protein